MKSDFHRRRDSIIRQATGSTINPFADPASALTLSSDPLILTSGRGRSVIRENLSKGGGLTLMSKT